MEGLDILRHSMSVGAALLLLYEFLIARPSEEERRWERYGNIAGALLFLAAAAFLGFSR